MNPLGPQAPILPSSWEAGAVQRLLFIRTDAIGDAILAADQIRLVHDRFPVAALAVACPESVADLYRTAPFPLQVLSYDAGRFNRSWALRLKTLGQLRAFSPTQVLNGMVTRTTVCDFLALGAGAPVRIGWAQTGRRRLRDRFLDLGYTYLMPPASGNELQRNQAFLDRLRVPAGGYGPQIWNRPEDEAWAGDWLRETGVPPDGFILLFAGAQQLRRGYSGYGEALAMAFPGGDIPVVAVGAREDWAENQLHLEAYPGPTFNLCGLTSLPRLAALARTAKLAFGAETGVSHVACAVGLPQVVLMGGGHFGRFHPYSPLTTLVCLPLDCYGCDWACRYDRAHCIHDITPVMLSEALRQVWETPSSEARILYPARQEGLEGGPIPISPKRLPVWIPIRWGALGSSGSEDCTP